MANKNIIGLIDTRQTYHSTQSITRWKQAINAFENQEYPSRVLLYDMYDDILLDGQVEAVWGKRLDAILNRRLTFIRDGAEDEEISKLLNSPDMRILLKELLNTRAYGFTLIQINNIYYDDNEECYHIDYDLIPRKHVHPEQKFQCVSKEQSSVEKDFLFMRQPLSNYMLWAGEPTDKGLFIKVAPYVIYKRGGFGDWAQFSEMFGMPFREAIYNSFDEDTRNRIEQFLKNWGSSSYFVHQNDVELKIHETGGSTASADIYDKFISVCDAGISKTILGNTLTTEQGDNGACSLGEVHADEQKSKEQNDEQFILSILNTRFRAIIKRFGIPATNGKIRFEAPSTDWSKVQTKWNVIKSVAEKVPVDDDYIYEETGIPKPENYDRMKAEQEERRKAMMEKIKQQPDDSGNDPEDDKQPDNTKKKLAARIADIFGVAPM